MDFTLVVVLVLGLFLGVLQLGLALHTRNVLVAAAQEGARVAAGADATEQDGVRRTRALIADALSERAAADMEVEARVVRRSGAAVVEVTVRGPLPVQLLPVSPVTVTVSGHALEESR
ncbi:MAG: TadE/TadG family type IV pilus assembly protein [Mycobacteriales bacterium]|nr:TadE/TadG family type IV pilus assembly protein [Mycobacteriales bacterium]